MSEAWISTPDDLRPWLSQLRTAKVVAVGLSTSGPDPHGDLIRSILLAMKDQPVLVLDCPTLLPDGIATLREILATSAVKIFHDAKADLPFLAALGIFPKPLFDTSLAAQLLNLPDDPEDYGLPFLTNQYLGESEGALADENPVQESVHSVKLLLRLREAMVPLLYRNGLATVAEIEFQCVRALAHIEYRGIRLDTDKWRKLTEQTKVKRDETLKSLYAHTESTVVQKTFWGDDDVRGPNFDSNACVLKLLQDHGIPVAGTSKWDLYPYRDDPLVQTVIEYRKASKSLSAFLYPLPELIHPATGRLHPRYGQLVASSGRMSAWNPNIQQIPRSKSFRECFAAPPGRRLVIADYSQIELRVVAQVSRDERMIAAFQQGEDLHLLTASHIANKPMELVSKQERQAYKAVNLGFIYGMGAGGLRTTAQMSYDIEMSMEDATLFRKRFFDTYRGVARWHREVMNTASNEGRTLTGRRLTFRKEAGLPERSNLPVQGTAADIIKKALGLLVDRIDSETKIIAVVHDEILVECPESRSGETAVILKSAMEDAANGILPDVPTPVEPVVSTSWAEK